MKIKKSKADKKIYGSDPRGVYQPLMFMPKNIPGWKKKICIAVPTTGSVRVEWMMSRFGQVIPVNWSNGDIFQPLDQFSPMGYAVADARNFCVQHSIQNGFEWTFFIDHDTMLPPRTFLIISKYMLEMKHPVVCGLYYCKGSDPEPLLFRGRGNSYFKDWKFGDKVWVDGIPMGCTLIHNSILKLMWQESEPYHLPTTAGGHLVRKVFETPRQCDYEPETNSYASLMGTEDIYWCDRIMSQNVLKRAGWHKHAKMKHPFLIDTAMFCQHIDENGVMYPANIGITYNHDPRAKQKEIK